MVGDWRKRRWLRGHAGATRTQPEHQGESNHHMAREGPVTCMRQTGREVGRGLSPLSRSSGISDTGDSSSVADFTARPHRLQLAPGVEQRDPGRGPQPVSARRSFEPIADVLRGE